MDILTIYQFCTFGGVERVLLNRASAFKKSGMDVTIHVGYLNDYGALSSFKHYIQMNGLNDYLVPFLLEDKSMLHKNGYPLITVIDTPQIFDEISSLENVVIECHTPYVENQQYLKIIPKNINSVIVPSYSFQTYLIKEFPELKNVKVWSNPVSEDFFVDDEQPKRFTKRPLTVLSRMDSLKNVSETMEIFQSVNYRDDIFFILIGRGISIDQRVDLLEQKRILNNTLFRDNIPFNDVPKLTTLVKQNRGLFVSSSKGESFGLSAAEFICRGVPVLLSDIPAHADLVNHDDRFLYPLGNITLAKEKVIYLLDNWDSMSIVTSSFREKFRYTSFIQDWTQFIHAFGC